MPSARFQIGQEVHVSQHCDLCRKLESCLKHPVAVMSVLPYDERSFTYRIEDAGGAHYEVSESCLCTSAGGHSANPCVHCGQKAA